MIDVRELVAYGSASMPTVDTQQAGGAIDLATRVEFSDLDMNDYVQLVAQSVTENDVQVTIEGRLATGVIESQTLTASGTSVVLSSLVFERLMRVMKTGNASLPIAVERRTPVFQGSAAGASANSITLPSSASSVDGTYSGMVIRLTSGPGSGQIARILGYIGSTREALVDVRWAALPSSMTGFRISVGVVLLSVIQRVRRPFWNPICDFRGGLDRYYYEKIFLRNESYSDTLGSALVLENWNPSGLISFSLDADVDDSQATVSRRTSPSDLVFDRLRKQIPGLDLAPQSAVGVWLELRLPAGNPPVKSSYGISLTGVTV